jgi:hypothetical protein
MGLLRNDRRSQDDASGPMKGRAPRRDANF